MPRNEYKARVTVWERNGEDLRMVGAGMTVESHHLHANLVILTPQEGQTVTVDASDLIEAAQRCANARG